MIFLFLTYNEGKSMENLKIKKLIKIYCYFLLTIHGSTQIEQNKAPQVGHSFGTLTIKVQTGQEKMSGGFSLKRSISKPKSGVVDIDIFVEFFDFNFFFFSFMNRFLIFSDLKDSGFEFLNFSF